MVLEEGSIADVARSIGVNEGTPRLVELRASTTGRR
jgi:hypothetical protein